MDYQKYDFDTSKLDDIIIGHVEPRIYAFTTEMIPNRLKVGGTFRPVTRRLNEWKKSYPNLEKQFEGSARIEGEDNYFLDYSVHRFLENDRGRKPLKKSDYEKEGISPDVRYSKEFFKDATKEDVADAIKDINKYFHEIKNHTVTSFRNYIYYDYDRIPHKVADYDLIEPICDYEPRANQREVIDRFNKAVNSGRTNLNLLMYAVMRFGKSFTSMWCAKENNCKLVVIVSAKADVKDEWAETILSHKKLSYKSDEHKGYHFLTSEDLRDNDSVIEEILNKEGRIAVFLTLQDLQGEFIKEKHEEIFRNEIDLLIVDETHYGARGEKYGAVLPKPMHDCENTVIVSSADNATDEIDEDFTDSDEADEIIKILKSKVTLHLSGTPYRILLNNNEFKKEDIIASVKYSDIIKAQEEWEYEHEEDIFRDEKFSWKNPYYGFPQMIRFAFNLNESSRNRLKQLEDRGKTSDPSVLFCPKSVTKSPDNSHKKFVYQNEVLDLLKVLDGSEKDNKLMGFLNYDKFKKGDMCKHIVMVLPYKASCDAMETLINSYKAKSVNLKDYQIINISGFECQKKYQTNKGVKDAIKEFEQKKQKTITLTAKRMLTGSTVEEWDTMFFMSGTRSPQEYDQATFRLQNTYIRNLVEIPENNPEDNFGDRGVGSDLSSKTYIRENMKPQTLLVDFDPTRMFVMQERRAQVYNLLQDKGGNDSLEKFISDELAVSPIISVNANKLVKIDNPVDIMKEVSNYNNNRGIKEEAIDIPVDLSIMSDSVIFEAIKREKEIGSRGSLAVKPSYDNPEGEDGNIDIPGETDVEGQNKEPQDTPKPAGDKEKSLDPVKQIQNYYARILLYAFITDSEVTSLKGVLNSFDYADNKRIVSNLGLDEKVLRAIYGFYVKNNKAILSDLDYKILDLNGLSHDKNLDGSKKAEIAMKKFGQLDSAVVLTPSAVCDNMVNLIPDEVFANIFNNGGKILDLAGVAGEFAAALDKRLKTSNISADNKSDCIYTVPKSSVCYELTRKMYKMLGLNVDLIATKFNSFDLLDTDKLCVTENGKLNKSKYGNVKKNSIEKLRIERVSNLLSQEKLFSKIDLSDECSGTVKFDVILSNPPYQKLTNGAQAQATPLYDKFVSQAKDLSDFFSMIIPARWYTGGFGLDSFRQEMLHDVHISELHDYYDSYDCFPFLGHDCIKGGVCYFAWNIEHTINSCKVYSPINPQRPVSRPLFTSFASDFTKGDNENTPAENDDAGIFVRYNGVDEIISRVQEKNEESFCSIVSSQKPFDISTNFSNYEKAYRAGSIKIFGNKFIGYLPDGYKKEKNKEYVGKWKLFIPKAVGTGNSRKDWIVPILAGPNTICTETYIAIGPFDSKEEAINASSYINTRFFHFLLTIMKNSQDALAKVYTFIPRQNFSESWDDDKLYAKYNLTKYADVISSIVPQGPRGKSYKDISGDVYPTDST